MKLHPAIAEELALLKERFPGKVELTLDDYAEYFGLRRQYAPQHFQNVNRGRLKINHKRIGRKTILIPLLDFAVWLAQKKVVDGKPLIITDTDLDMKRRRGFAQPPGIGYRSVG